MNDSTNKRKIEHIDIVMNDKKTDRDKQYWDEIQLINRGLPQLDLEKVDTVVRFLGKTCSFPLLISSMTGGDHDHLETINHNLAAAAEKTNVPMAVGSQRVMFTAPKSYKSFTLRDKAPSIPLIANLGAVQLNYGFDETQCQQAIDILNADALYLHLNPLQETIQPEGDTNFSGLAEKIGHIGRILKIPVILKEVGAGLSRPDALLAVEQGIRYLDIAGRGGTSWSRIENSRFPNSEQLGLIFQDWGIPTPAALHQLKSLRHQCTLIASGGIRTGIDMAKAVILGADMCGIAGPFLKYAMDSTERVIDYILKLKTEFRTAMFLLGAASIKELKYNETLILHDPFKRYETEK